MSVTSRPTAAARTAPVSPPPRPRLPFGGPLTGPVDGSRLAGLDGLRGVAVMLVVLDHAHVDGSLHHILSVGGAAGVTIFFVLSGFLITSLLLREHDVHGRIDLAAFWGRRALRLLPALWVWLVAVTLLFAGAGWSPLGFFIDTLAKPVLLYYSDLAGIGRGLGPVAHTWSLAVEEQFYLVWPLLVLGLLWCMDRRPGRSGVRLLTVVLVLLTVLGAWWRLRVGDQPRGPLVAARRPDTNAVCLLAGAAVAAAVRVGWTPRPWLHRLGWPAVAAMLVVPRVEPVHRELDAANVGVLLTVLAAVTVCACLTTGSRVFTSPPLRALGALSYGFYLWHFPLLAAYAGGLFRPLGDHAAATAALVVPVSLACAYLSFTLVERPLLRRYRGRLERVRLRPRTTASTQRTTGPRRVGAHA